MAKSADHQGVENMSIDKYPLQQTLKKDLDRKSLRFALGVFRGLTFSTDGRNLIYRARFERIHAVFAYLL
jgi:hypothetical protein